MSAPLPRDAGDPSDETLMSRVASGDLDAFGAIVDRHHARALNLAWRLSGDAELARDAAQESFLRILQAAPRWQPRARFTTFLFVVTRNLVREMLRAERRRREEPLEGEPEIAPGGVASPGSADPLHTLERSELGERLIAALDTLPERLRSIFVLSELEGLSYAEIAEVCDCPAGTVASRKHEAILRLRETLAPLVRNEP